MKNIIGLLVLCVVFLGCTEEINISVLSDIEEIERYVHDADLGKDFFRTSNIITETPYGLHFDTGAIYVDHLDSINRDINARLSSSDQEIGVVEVTDYFYVTTSKLKNSVNSTATSKRMLKRYGYFEKLGDDGQRFSGWQIRGFSGQIAYTSSGVTLYREDNSVFSNGYDYVASFSSPSDSKYSFLTSSASLIGRINNGETLRAKINAASISDSKLLSAETSTGYTYKGFNPTDSSVEFTTPLSHSQSWNLIIYEDIFKLPIDTTLEPGQLDSIGFGLGARLWCEPYRVD